MARKKKDNVDVKIEEKLEISVSDKYKVKKPFTADICNRKFDCKLGEEIVLNQFEHKILTRFLE